MEWPWHRWFHKRLITSTSKSDTLVISIYWVVCYTTLTYDSFLCFGHITQHYATCHKQRLWKSFGNYGDSVSSSVTLFVVILWFLVFFNLPFHHKLIQTSFSLWCCSVMVLLQVYERSQEKNAVQNHICILQKTINV